VGAEELLVLALEFVQVPPLADLLGYVAEREVVGPEQVGVAVQIESPQHVGGRVVRMGGDDPDARRGHAEAEAGEFGAQHVPLVALRLGHGEDGEQPAVGDRCPGAPEDARVAFAENGQRLRGQLVTRLAILPPGRQDAAPLEPGYSRTHRRLVHAQVGEQPDQRGDGQPAAVGPGIEPVEGDDQVPRAR